MEELKNVTHSPPVSDDVKTAEPEEDKPVPDKNPMTVNAEMLLDLSRQMAACETLDAILRRLVEILTSGMNADRGTVFLKDNESNELYSRVTRASHSNELKVLEIRILADRGVAGHVFTTGEPANVPDAYHNERFDPSVDEKTGYRTKSILCIPVKTVKGEIIGVAQVLNKKRPGVVKIEDSGKDVIEFTEADEKFIHAITVQAAVALQTAQIVERVEKVRMREQKLLEVVADITSEIDLSLILQKVMSQATKMIESDRSTLFLNDEKTDELFSKIAAGLEGVQEIRLPNNVGIAGMVFTSGHSVNIPYAYADIRFNPGFDKKTGYFTRSILCVPVNNKQGKTIGVIQLLNKRRGVFTDEDESKLRTFTAQVSIALENAKLFDDVQNIKNRNESMLESMSSGVITMNEEGKIVTCNAAGYKIMNLEPKDIIDKQAGEFFNGDNGWIMEKIRRVEKSVFREPDVTMDAELVFGEPDVTMDAELVNHKEEKKKEEKIAANVTVLPLISVEKTKLGSMIMIEDISSEKRMKSTMSKYMDPDVADQLLAGGEDVLGGKSGEATVLFSDIRNFTTMTEELGAQGTVSFLNEYFTIMVDCIQKEGGMLDKFIGDAIMAAFGIPVFYEDSAERGVRTAIFMLREMFRWNEEERKERKEKPIDMGVGLNTGVVVTGNIGSPKRMDYTMIGDGVNLASRLESACKQYFARILISEFTYDALKKSYYSREIDRVVVKGKTKPVGVYELLDYHNYTYETFPNMKKVLAAFEDGLKEYRAMNWEHATEAFQDALSLNPEDKLSNMYIERCSHLQKNPPGEEWDGVWVMKSK